MITKKKTRSGLEEKFNIVEPYITGGISFLEYGCKNGELSSLLKDVNYTGVVLDKEIKFNNKKTKEFRLLKLMEFASDKTTYDVIFLDHVLSDIISSEKSIKEGMKETEILLSFLEKKLNKLGKIIINDFSYTLGLKNMLNKKIKLNLDSDILIYFYLFYKKFREDNSYKKYKFNIYSKNLYLKGDVNSLTNFIFKLFLELEKEEKTDEILNKNYIGIDEKYIPKTLKIFYKQDYPLTEFHINNIKKITNDKLEWLIPRRLLVLER